VSLILGNIAIELIFLAVNEPLADVSMLDFVGMKFSKWSDKLETCSLSVYRLRRK
jgi:hypothetical protein